MKPISRMSNLGSKLGGLANKTGHGLGSAYRGTLGGGMGSDLFSSFAQSAFGTKGNIAGGIGRIAGSAGSVALLGNAVKYGAGLMGYGKPAAPEKKIKTKEEIAWQKKTQAAVQRGTVDDYTPEDLDLDYNSTDEGWRAGVGAFSKEDFNGMAKTAIESNDATSIWNAVARKAKANGKEIKTNKPVYIPGIMNKNGKQMAYAIAFGDDQKPKLVPIEMGKGVVWEE